MMYVYDDRSNSNIIVMLHQYIRPIDLSRRFILYLWTALKSEYFIYLFFFFALPIARTIKAIKRL